MFHESAFWAGLCKWTGRKRIKGEDIYSGLDLPGLDLRYVDAASKGLKKLFACFGCETAELCLFEYFAKRPWVRRNENAPRSMAVASSSSMIPSFSSDFIVRSGRFYQLFSPQLQTFWSLCSCKRSNTKLGFRYFFLNGIKLPVLSQSNWAKRSVRNCVTVNLTS